MSISKIVLRCSVHTLDDDTNHVYFDLFNITKIIFYREIYLKKRNLIYNYMQFRKMGENMKLCVEIKTILSSYKIN